MAKPRRALRWLEAKTMRRLLLTAALLVPFGAVAQPVQAPGLSRQRNLSDVPNPAAARTNLGLGTAAQANTGTSGATVPLLNGANTWSAPQTFPSVNTTGAAGYQITGLPAMNLLANQTSPIVSPETANSPTPGAIYFPQPLVVGYASTYAPNTYESMVTSNLTINGTVTNHYGQIENTINLLATGGTMNAELNNQKNYVVVPSGFTLSTGENFEAMISNSGATTVWSGYTFGPVNNSTGTIGQAIGLNSTPSNNNTTNNSFPTVITVNCNAPVGSGTIANRFCVYNQDGGGEIANAGHYASRPDGQGGGASPTATATGGTVTLNSRATDTIFTVTETGSVTQVVVTLHKSASGSAQYVCSSPSGEVITSYTASVTSSLTYNHAAGAGTVTCLGMDGF
jgi:hypothetical protein